MSPEEFLKEFGHLAETEGGVGQLRAAIFQLAVKGTLVAQDSADAPASSLLKELTGVTPEHRDWNQWQLPRGWISCWLEDLCSRVHYGVTAKAVDTPKGPRMLRITDIQNDRVNWDAVPGCDIDDATAAKSALADGDIVIARTGGTIGKTYLVENLDRSAVFASYLIRAVPFSSDFSPYLKLYTGSAHYWEQLRAGTAGTGLPNVSGTTLKALRIPLPPLPEQKRIVEKVDQLMTLCDELEAKQKQKRAKAVSFNQAALSAVVHASDKCKLKSSWSRVQDHFEVLYELPENVKELRQTILQLAVMGKLVRQEEGDGVVDQERLGSLGRGSKEGARTTSLIDPPARPVLPANWAWLPLRAVTSLVTDGEHQTPPRVARGVLLATAKNVRDGFLDLTSTDFVSSSTAEKCRRRCCPTDGDILMVCVGATTGRLTVLTEPPEMVLVRSVALVRPDMSKISSNYLALLLNSPLGQQQIWAGVKRSAQPCLYLSRIDEIMGTIPPFAEQERIVAKVGGLMTLCNDLEAKLAQHRDQGQRLMQAVVEGLVA